MSSNKNLSIDETFAKAIEYHKVKKIDLAKKFYKEVINKDPHHIHALNNLGIILFSLIPYPYNDDALTTVSLK